MRDRVATAAFLMASALGSTAWSCPVGDRQEVVSRVQDPRLAEISGMVVSPRDRSRFWVHNDSGDAARIYLVDRAGTTVSEAELVGVEAIDFEDMAVGECDAGPCLVVADIGDNGARRAEVSLYFVPEPEVGQAEVVPSRTLRFTYADGPRDAEAFFIDPLSPDRAYIVEKNEDPISGIYELDLGAATPVARRVAEVRTDEDFPYPNSFTAADISRDGERIVMRTYLQVVSYCRGGRSLVEAFADAPTILYAPGLLQAEALAVGDEDVWLTSERRPTPLVRLFTQPPEPLDMGGMEEGPDAGTGDAGAKIADAGGVVEANAGADGGGAIMAAQEPSSGTGCAVGASGAAPSGLGAVLALLGWAVVRRRR